MFRWDAQQRFAARSGKAWIAVALLSWAIVGGLSEYRGRIVSARGNAASQQAVASQPSSTPSTTPPSTPSTPETTPPPAPSTPETAPPPATVRPEEPAAPPSTVTLSGPEKKAAAPPAGSKPDRAAPAPNPPESSTAAAPSPEPAPGRSAKAAPEQPQPPQTIAPRWQAVKPSDIDRDLVFDRLPSDAGIVTPIAPDTEDPDTDVGEHLQFIRQMLPSWQPGKIADPVQRVRNVLYVAAVPDVLQMPIERFAPWAVFDYLQEEVPKEQLIKLLYWIALHPNDGDDAAVDQLWALRFPNGGVDMQQTRERAAIYAVKLLGRVLGKLPATQ